MRPLPVETMRFVAGGHVHHEDLVAGVGLGSGLEDEALAVRAPVGLGVLAAEGELAQVLEVLLVGPDQGRRVRRGLRAKRGGRGEGEAQGERDAAYSSSCWAR